jgi:hypothetical protein
VPSSNERPDMPQRRRRSSNERATASAADASRLRTVDDLARGGGPPLTTSELARMIGMSATFIRLEIGSGYLRAAKLGRGRKAVFRIPCREAFRYVRKLGLL